MEKRLQDFILSVQQLSDLRNLDTFNPIVFQFEHPITATRYTVVGAKIEPSYLGLPINVTWVVLDPTDPYYMKALKLKATIDPETLTDKPKVVGFDAWWHVVRTYDEIFNDPQYYVGVEGVPGPVGPTGPAGVDGIAGPVGPTGPAGTTVDPAAVMALLGQLSGTLEIQGPASIQSQGSQQYTVWLTETVVDNQGATSVQTRQVYPPIRIVQSGADALPAGTSLSYDNILTAGTTNLPIGATLIAEYPSWTRIVQTQKAITIGSAPVTVTGLVINGPNVLVEGGTVQFTVTASYSDGSTAQVAAAWSSSDANVLAVDAAGMGTAGQVTTSTPVTVTATFDGQTYTKTLNVTDVPTVQSLTISGPNAVFESTTGQYSAVVTYSDGSTQSVAPTWSISVGTDASINASGLLTANALNGTDGAVTVSASYQGVTGTKNVTITNKVVASLNITGPNTVQGGASATYTASVTYNDGTTAAVTPTWSAVANGTITSGGVLTADNVSGIIVVDATYTTAEMQVVTASKNVTVSMALDPGYPFYGVGPALPADWQTFILGLPYRGPTATVTADIAFDALGQNAYMYFCYPKSYGEAQFFDKLSQFFGGWGGGGNSGPGPSAATIAASADKPYTATITYNGAQTEFYVYRSEYANLGAAASNQWAVSPLP